MSLGRIQNFTWTELWLAVQENVAVAFVICVAHIDARGHEISVRQQRERVNHGSVGSIPGEPVANDHVREGREKLFAGLLPDGRRKRFLYMPQGLLEEISRTLGLGKDRLHVGFGFGVRRVVRVLLKSHSSRPLQNMRDFVSQQQLALAAGRIIEAGAETDVIAVRERFRTESAGGFVGAGIGVQPHLS
jgi:hypothetical protein